MDQIRSDQEYYAILSENLWCLFPLTYILETKDANWKAKEEKEKSGVTGFWL